MALHTSPPLSQRMKSCSSSQGDVWSYRESPHRALTVALAFGVIVCAAAVLLLGGDSLTEKVPFILLFVLMTGLTAWFVQRTTTVVISKKDDTIRKDERSLIFRRCYVYSLKDFPDMALTVHVRAGEDGYLIADYSIVLKGPKGKLVILTTRDREEAVRIREELCGYLENNSGPTHAIPERPRQLW